jgi:hypothetical protein
LSNDLTQFEGSGAAAIPATDSLVGDHFEGAGIASPFTPEMVARKAELEKIRDTDIDRYFSERHDRELLRIMKAEMAAVDPDSVSPLDPMDWQEARREFGTDVAGSALVSEWERAGGFRLNYERVQERVSKLVGSFETRREQRAFMARFDRDLTESCRNAIYSNIAQGRPTFVRPADAATMKQFAATDVGQELIAEWGPDAPEKVALIRTRAARFYETLSDDDLADFGVWFESLKPRQIAAICRSLVR